MERGWLGLVRRKDRLVSGRRPASTRRFMKFWWCADPAPSTTTSIKSSCVCSILELDLFWRICVWCHKEFGGAGKNHIYTTLHDPLLLTCLPHALFIRTSLVSSMVLNTPGRLLPEGLHTCWWLYLNALLLYNHMAYILPSFWSSLSCPLTPWGLT